MDVLSACIVTAFESVQSFRDVVCPRLPDVLVSSFVATILPVYLSLLVDVDELIVRPRRLCPPVAARLLPLSPCIRTPLFDLSSSRRTFGWSGHAIIAITNLVDFFISEVLLQRRVVASLALVVDSNHVHAASLLLD